jgi:hypothetical protein
MINFSDYEYRKQPGFDMNKHVKLYGFFYEISSGKLTEVVRDIPVSIAV